MNIHSAASIFVVADDYSQGTHHYGVATFYFALYFINFLHYKLL